MKVYRLLPAALGLSVCVLAPAGLEAQANPPTGPAAEAIRVFIDCHTDCDTEYTRREITYVNWVRDRQDADVHLIIRSQGTGGGGDEFTLQFIGLRAFQGIDDELKFTTRQSDTQDEIRAQQTQRIGLGLARYVARSVFADRLRLSFSAPPGGAAAIPAQQPHDPWNLWIFRVGASASLRNESQFKRHSYSGSLRASRVSEMWKVRLTANFNRSHSTYTLSDSSLYKTTVASYRGSSILVRSLGDHFSAGMETNVSRSTSDNYDLSVETSAGLEYDFFPYKESSKRQFVLVYSLGVSHANYRDTTIYNKVVETRPVHSFNASAQATQPWGSLSAELNASSYLDNFSQNRVSVFGYCSVRLVRGLDLNFNAGYSRIRDQLSLLKTGLTDEEILLQLKQIRTDYRYNGSISLSYTFGSKFNNVVNPRFNGSGGNCFCDGGSCFCG